MISIRHLTIAFAILSTPSIAWAGTLNVSMRPGGGEAVIITHGDFRLCEARRIEPWDPVRCPGWRSLTGGPGFSGGYCVLAWWGGGPGGARFRRGFKMTIGVPQYRLEIAPQQPSQPAFCR